MKIVIDIPDFIYTEIRNITENTGIIEHNAKALYNAIYYGTPLPEHHGDLIDRDELLIKSEWYGERSTYSNPMPNGESAVPEEVVLNAPTIIEADKESEE